MIAESYVTAPEMPSFTEAQVGLDREPGGIQTYGGIRFLITFIYGNSRTPLHRAVAYVCPATLHQVSSTGGRIKSSRRKSF